MRPEQRPARLPDTSGAAMREGVSLHYDTYGDGATTVLLVPAWSIVRPWHRLRRHRLPDRGIELIRDR